jgi:hypothetical protein
MAEETGRFANGRIALVRLRGTKQIVITDWNGWDKKTIVHSCHAKDNTCFVGSRSGSAARG